MAKSTIYKILAKKKLAESITQMDLYAPQVVRHAQPGQFLIVIPGEKDERIPLTIADTQRAQGAVRIIFQEVGFSTQQLGQMNVGEAVYAVLGPLGHPTPVGKLGTVVCVGGGVGIAEILPIARAYKSAGNRVISIIGSRTRSLLILEDELKKNCDELLAATDDGSYGHQGFVTEVLKDVLPREACALVYAVGPVMMMKAVSDMTRPLKIKTVVSLNPVMVDATGMCGVCRCRVAGKTVFGCVDGPEFNAHEVDFDELEQRLNFYQEEENVIKKFT